MPSIFNSSTSVSPQRWRVYHDPGPPVPYLQRSLFPACPYCSSGDCCGATCTSCEGFTVPLTEFPENRDYRTKDGYPVMGYTGTSTLEEGHVIAPYIPELPGLYKQGR